MTNLQYFKENIEPHCAFCCKDCDAINEKYCSKHIEEWG